MASFSPWRTAEDSQILLRFSFTSQQEHTIQVTDLSSVYTRTLSKTQILKQAQEEECSIDPSQDDEQYDIFLQKLRNGLSGREKCFYEYKSVPNRASARLKISCPLPKPLRPLEWTWHLDLMSGNGLSSEVLAPLAATNCLLQQRIDQLCKVLSKKDAAVSKLLDKLESIPLDIAAVIPQVSMTKTGRGETKKQQLVRHIKGLEAFNERDWRSSRDGDQLELRTFDQLFNTAFKDSDDVRVVNVTQGMKESTWAANFCEMSDCRARAGEEMIEPVESQAGDDFQRQTTPPRLRGQEYSHPPSAPRQVKREEPSQPESKTVAHAGIDLDGDATTDEDENFTRARETPPSVEKHLSRLAPLASTQAPSSLGTSPSASPRKLGTIGGVRKPSAAESSTPPTPDNVIPSDPLNHNEPLPERSSKPPGIADSQTPRQDCHKKKLGVISGREKQEHSKTSSISPMENPPCEQSASLSGVEPEGKLEVDAKAKHGGAKRIGAIGGRRGRGQTELPNAGSKQGSDEANKDQPMTSFDLSEDTRKSPIKSNSTGNDLLHDEKMNIRPATAEEDNPVSKPQEQESSHSKADRKREELKRALDSKQKTQTKRRKF